jgi:hypothetical protein
MAKIKLTTPVGDRTLAVLSNATLSATLPWLTCKWKMEQIWTVGSIRFTQIHTINSILTVQVTLQPTFLPHPSRIAWPGLTALSSVSYHCSHSRPWTEDGSACVSDFGLCQFQVTLQKTASRSLRHSVQWELPIEFRKPPCGKGWETPIENRFEGFTVLADTNQHDIPSNF